MYIYILKDFICQVVNFFAVIQHQNGTLLEYHLHAGFYTIKTFDGFRFDEITLPADLTPESLQSLDFIKEKKNIIMYGRTGTGKTFLSTALGVTACQRGIPVKFYRTAALVNQLSEAKRTSTLGTLLKRLNKASVLILDEWGYVPYDRTGAQLLFDYLSEIHEQKPIILNTNLEFSGGLMFFMTNR